MELTLESIEEVIQFLKDKLDRDYENHLIEASKHCDIDSWLDEQLRVIKKSRD